MPATDCSTGACPNHGLWGNRPYLLYSVCNSKGNSHVLLVSHVCVCAQKAFTLSVQALWMAWGISCRETGGVMGQPATESDQHIIPTYRAEGPRLNCSNTEGHNPGSSKSILAAHGGGPGQSC